MAEVRKKVLEDTYNTRKIKTADVKKSTKEVKKVEKKQDKNNNKKQNAWVRFKIFCHGVKSEFDKVHWPTKANMLKYSIATVVFIILCSAFFYVIDIIFALIQTLFN